MSSNRTTEADLKAAVKRINILTNSPLEPYVTDEHGKLHPQAFCYHLDWAYGGVTLYRMCETGTGCSTPLNCGHVSKRDLYNLMQAYIKGLQYE